MKLQGKVALLTGAAQGIGLACAQRLAQEGALLVISDVATKPLEDARKALSDKGFQVVAQVADVTSKAACEALVATAIKSFGRVDILVSNAGIVHAAEFLDLEEADFDRVIAVNLKGMFLVGQCVARAMAKQLPDARGSRGVIINMSSVNAVLAISNQIPYVTSKGGVNQLTRAMAISLAPHGIRVNAIGPGTILTELARNAVLGNAAAEKKILSRTPMKRMGDVSEIASVAAFLASDDGSYFTGQTLYPDGGRLALNYTMQVD
jgi:glucose 1-dehydrogenase